ncbi:hypothetical protein BC831DRAFT_449881 [Entophlyctis helioformis]|nr:hypothetical protein BC831DRAFT_449881 [Entophlyctis helioformis]
MKAPTASTSSNNSKPLDMSSLSDSLSHSDSIINRDMVRQQLVDLGYSSSALPDAVLDDFGAFDDEFDTGPSLAGGAGPAAAHGAAHGAQDGLLSTSDIDDDAAEAAEDSGDEQPLVYLHSGSRPGHERAAGGRAGSSGSGRPESLHRQQHYRNGDQMQRQDGQVGGIGRSSSHRSHLGTAVDDGYDDDPSAGLATSGRQDGMGSVGGGDGRGQDRLRPAQAPSASVAWPSRPAKPKAATKPTPAPAATETKPYTAKQEHHRTGRTGRTISQHEQQHDACSSSISHRLAGVDLSGLRHTVSEQVTQARRHGQQELPLPHRYQDDSQSYEYEYEQTGATHLLHNFGRQKQQQREDDDTTDALSVVSGASGSSGMSDFSLASSSRPQSGFIRVAPAKRPTKRHDPVARFHQHQAEWSRNGFLRRSEKRDKTPQGTVMGTARWGGVAGPPLAAMGLPAKPRHNLAAMRPTFVVPTEKTRRDVVWQVRSRLAMIHNAYA